MADQPTDGKNISVNLRRRGPVLLLLIAGWIAGGLRPIVIAVIILARSSGPAQDLESLQHQAEQARSKYMSHDSYLSPKQRAQLPPGRVDEFGRDKEALKEGARLHEQAFDLHELVRQESQRRKYEHDRPHAYTLLAIGFAVTAICIFSGHRIATRKSPLIP